MVGIQLILKFPNFMEKLRKALPEIQIFLAATMQTNRALMFDKEGAHNGHPKWKPLVFRTGMILSNRGVLRRSIAPVGVSGKPGPGGIVQFNGGEVIIGTQVAYARLMNDGTKNFPGGVMRPVNAKALMIPLPAGKKATSVAKKLRKGATKITTKSGKTQNVIFRKSVKIPARPFDEWNDADQEELSEALLEKIVEVLSR